MKGYKTAPLLFFFFLSLGTLSLFASEHLPKSKGADGDLFDRANFWKTWKDISEAIKLVPLDGPEEILEKVEIIDDRIDELEREKGNLSKEMELLVAQRQSLDRQIGVMEEISANQKKGDLQFERHIYTLKEQNTHLMQRVDTFRQSILDLDRLLVQLQQTAAQYRLQAETLRHHEKENR